MTHYSTPQPRESRDKWLSIQSNTFLDWVNHWLKNRDIEISDLGKDFSDGLNLIHLVEVLSGSKVGRYVKNPRFPGQKIDNIQIAISFIEKTWNVQCIGLNAMDIMEGNHKQILGLIFLLVNKISKQYKLDNLDHDEGETESILSFPPVFTVTNTLQSTKEKTVTPELNPPQLELSKSASDSPSTHEVHETFGQKKEKFNTKPTEKRESRPKSFYAGKLVNRQEKQHENMEKLPEKIPETLPNTSTPSESVAIIHNEIKTDKPVELSGNFTKLIPPEENTKETPTENIVKTENLFKENLTENVVENIGKYSTENQTEKLPDNSTEITEEKTSKSSQTSQTTSENPVEVQEETHGKIPEVTEVKDPIQSPEASVQTSGTSTEQIVTSDQNQNDDKSPPVIPPSELSGKEPDNESIGKHNKEQIAVPSKIQRFTEEDISCPDSGTLKTARPIKREGLPKKGSTASLKRISTGDKPRGSSFKKKDTEKKKT